MNRSALLTHIEDELPDYNLLCLERVDSTNSEARRRAAQGGNWIITSDAQSDGRGRLGRAFDSTPGGIYLSFTYRPDFPPENSLHLTTLAALAVHDAVYEICGVRPEIKWPNDLLLGGQKFCGILTEAIHTAPDYFLITGIGINASNELPEELDGVTSLRRFTGSAPDSERLAAGVLRRAIDLYSRSQTEKSALLERYAALCVTIGKTVSVSSGTSVFTGTSIGIDENAALLVRRESGDVATVFSGEATLSLLT